MLAYWKLLILNRIAAIKPSSRRREGQKPWKAMLGYAGFALLALCLYAGVLALEMLLYHYAQAIGAHTTVIALVMLGCTAITLIYGFFYVISLLFFSKDNAFVGALPISSRAVLSAKLATVLAGEAGLTVLVCAPLLIRHGIEIGAAVGFYVRSLVGMLFLPCVPLAVATLLAFLLIRVSGLWKRREGVTTIATFVLLAAVLVAEMSLNLNMDEDQFAGLMLQTFLRDFDFTATIASFYPPLGWLINAITGSGAAAWGGVCAFIALSMAALALVVWLLGGGYLRLALRQEETMRRVNNGVKRQKGSVRVRKPFWALYRQEMREVITVPTYATNCLTGVVLFPVMIVVMAISMGRNMGDGGLVQMLAGFIPRDLYLAIATGILCLTATMGMAVPTAVSREGARHAFRRVYPVSGEVQLGAKLLMGVTYNAVTALTSAVALWVMLGDLWLETLIALGISQLFSMLWCMISLLLDVYHPKLNWKTEAEAVKQSVNAMIGMLLGFVALALLVGATLLMVNLGLTLAGAIAVDVALLLLMNVLLWLMMRGHASVTYCLREYSI